MRHVDLRLELHNQEPLILDLFVQLLDLLHGRRRISRRQGASVFARARTTWRLRFLGDLLSVLYDVQQELELLEHVLQRYQG